MANNSETLIKNTTGSLSSRQDYDDEDSSTVNPAATV